MGRRIHELIPVAARNLAEFVLFLGPWAWELAPLGQAVQKILQGLNFGGGGGVHSGVFLDHVVEVRLENAFGAQEGVGGVGGDFNPKRSIN